MSSGRMFRGGTQIPIRRRERFTLSEIEEIKTTGKLVLCIASAATFVVACYLWVAGGVTGGANKAAPSAPDAVPELSTPMQYHGDAATIGRVSAQQSCHEGNEDACTLLRQPDPLDMVSDPPAASGKEP